MSNALSLEVKRYLVHVCITRGWEVAGPLCAKYGIHRRTLSKYMLAAGHRTRVDRKILPAALLGAGSIVTKITAQRRIKRGWSMERAVTTPVRKVERVPHLRKEKRPVVSQVMRSLDKMWRRAIERGAISI